MKVDTYYRHVSVNSPFILKVNSISVVDESLVRMNVSLIPILREEWQETCVIEMHKDSFKNWYEVEFREGHMNYV